jgi:hypothetical protein
MASITREGAAPTPVAMQRSGVLGIGCSGWRLGWLWSSCQMALGRIVHELSALRNTA